MTHILHPYLPPVALCTRVLALAGAPCLASFFIDAHHRTRFLRAAASAPRSGADAAAAIGGECMSDEEGTETPYKCSGPTLRQAKTAAAGQSRG